LSSTDVSGSTEEVARSLDIPSRSDADGYLTVLNPGSASPMANRKYFMEKIRSCE